MLGQIDFSYQRTSSQLMSFPPLLATTQADLSPASLSLFSSDTCSLCWERRDTHGQLPCRHDICGSLTVDVDGGDAGLQDGWPMSKADMQVAYSPTTPVGATDDDSCANLSDESCLSSTDSLLSSIMGVVDLREEEEAVEEVARGRTSSSSSSSSLSSMAGGCPTTLLPAGGSLLAYDSGTGRDSSCSSCDDGGRASSRCQDCREALCDSCVQAHRRVRLTKEHYIIRYVENSCSFAAVAKTSVVVAANAAAAKATQQQLHSGSTVLAIGRSRSPCELHPQETVTVYCSTCLEPICGVCLSSSHRDHDVIYLTDAVNTARTSVQQLQKEARDGAAAADSVLEMLRRMLERVDRRAQAVSVEVRSETASIANALEEREQQLLARIELIRQVKGMALRAQIDEIASRLGRSRTTAALAGRVLDDASCYSGSTDLALLQCSKQVPELRHEVRSLQDLFSPREDEHLSFAASATALLDALTTFGAVSSGGYGPSSGPVGTAPRWAKRGRTASLLLQVCDHARNPKTTGGDAPKATLRGPEGPSGWAEVLDRANGTYMINFRSAVEGLHQLSVVLNGLHVQQSPFTVDFRNGHDFSRFCSGAVPAEPVLLFGREGEGDGELCRPWGVCCDLQGNIVVADRSNNRVQIFSAEGKFLRKFGTSGSRSGQFDRPAGVSVDPRGRIVVADKDNHRVQVFSSEGEFILKFGEKGARVGHFNYPWDVATDEQGRILVSDTRNHRIQLFSPEGNFLCKYGFEGASWKQFDSPRGVAFTVDGHAVVTDFNNHRIVVVDAQLRHARFLCGEGSGNGQFLRPQGIAVDQEGHLVVADSRNHRVQVFKPDGSFLTAFGTAGTASNQMDRPSGVCMTPDGRVLVVDFGNNRVVIY